MSKAITKDELIALIAEKKGITKKAAADELTFTCDLIKELLVSDHEIKIFNFLSIKPKVNESSVTVSVSTGASLKAALTESLL